MIVYTPDPYARHIAESCTEVTVQCLHSNVLLNFQKWCPIFYKLTCVSVKSYVRKIPKDKKVYFGGSNFCIYEYNSSELGTVKAMNTINSLLSHRFHLLTEANSPNLPTEYAYCGQYPINAKKLKHVEKLLNYIPDEYINFYNDIMAW